MFGGQAKLMSVTNLCPAQDYSKLVEECNSRGQLFEDKEFPASDHLLTDQAGGHIVSYFGRSRYVRDEIEWLRPGEICSKNGHPPPEMFVGEVDRFDINQGEIGDCWFLAALANLAENESCFRRVVPAGQSFRQPGYAGIFRFRFYRFGNWEEVVVDDRLPTRNGRLIYLRAKDPNEFWSPLLEKAYAKLYGSYKALEGGLTIEAAVDFTGGIPEVINLQDLKISPEALFYNMAQADSRKAFMSCSLSGSRHQREAGGKGLQARHAYTITKVVDVRCNGVNRSIPLIRMRNPHGNAAEWRGDWSDGDSYWKCIPKHKQTELGLDFSDDGEFYMNFNRDFLKYFGEVEIVHLTPTGMETEAGRGRQFDVFHFSGRWSRALGTDGGCGNDAVRNFARNPQFTFSLSDPDPYDDEFTCPVIIAISQKAVQRKTEWSIGFRIYKCQVGDQSLDATFLSRTQPIDKTDRYTNLREVSKRFHLPEGSYCVIPSTFNSGEEGEFLVRIFVEKKWGASKDGNRQTVREGGEVLKRPVDYKPDTSGHSSDSSESEELGFTKPTRDVPMNGPSDIGDSSGGPIRNVPNIGFGDIRGRSPRRDVPIIKPSIGGHLGLDDVQGLDDVRGRSPRRDVPIIGPSRIREGGGGPIRNVPITGPSRFGGGGPIRTNPINMPYRFDGFGGGGRMRNIPIRLEDRPDRKLRKRDRVKGFAMHHMEKYLPKLADKINKLRDYYHWTKDRDEELKLLKKIVQADD